MPAPQRGGPQDAMARDVERLLRQLKHPGTTPASTARLSARAAGAYEPDIAPADEPLTPLGVRGRVALGVLLAAGLTQWPYAQACGWPLAGYLAAASVVLLTGVWLAAATWRARLAVAHILAVAVLLAGAVFVMAEVIPRSNAAATPVPWRCAP
jgi:hypothetical protein